MVLQNCGTNIKLVSSYICVVLEFHQMLVLMCNVNLQGYDMGASKTAVGFIFSVYPLVGFFLAPVVGILVSNHLMACIHIHSISKCVVLTLILVCTVYTLLQVEFFGRKNGLKKSTSTYIRENMRHTYRITKKCQNSLQQAKLRS